MKIVLVQFYIVNPAFNCHYELQPQPSNKSTILYDTVINGPMAMVKLCVIPLLMYESADL